MSTLTCREVLCFKVRREVTIKYFLIIIIINDL
jgi:hypothetical protein